MVDKPEDEGSYDFAPEPEKGAAQPAPKPPVAEKPDLILPERTCPHCGFRIIGKPPRGRCPECSAPLDEKNTDHLQFSDGAWLKSMSVGTLLLAVAVAGHVLAVVLGWLNKLPQGSIMHFAAALTGVLAVWLATRREPGPGKAPLIFAPWARGAAIGVAVFWLVLIIKAPTPPVEVRDPSTDAAIVAQTQPVEGRNPMTVVVLVAMALEAAIVSLHLRTLAARVPNDSLVTQFLNLAFLVPGVCATLLVLHLMGLASIKHMDQQFLCGFSMIGGLGVALLWAVITLLRMAVELRNCAAAGEAIALRKAMKARAQEKADEGRKKREERMR